ncbi:MAG: trehalose-phosphatase [Myxococcota bacterium]|nr:trehalose-phosphatase [Deltaproteobacteria bacterium]MDQ3338296.1 trehalose-phosphatase [Myxococcota bacterium]
MVVALDLDGTLIPFAPTPHDAHVDGDAAALIADLSALPGVTVGVVTGRPRDLVDDLPPRFPKVVFAAEHGVWRYADGAWEAALPALRELDEIEGSLRSLAARHPGAIVERKSCSVCLHWRSVSPESHDMVSAAAEVIVDEWLETHTKLERLPVVEALEVRHRGAHKGTAISWLRTKGPPGAPMLAIGDDITDEDMFVTLREGDVGILVAEHPRRTQAGLRLPSITSVHKFLRWLIDARRQQPVLAPADAAATVNLQFARPPTLPTEARLVVASNRLPAAPTSTRGREVGGLVSALVPALTETSGLWLGWSGAERDPGLRLRVEDGEAFTRAQFDYPPTWRERFYAGFCNQSLWPLLHGMPGKVRYVDDEWACYVDANVAYASLIAQASGLASDVWVQDFHLMLVARELKKLGHRGRTGFYLHVPFPPLDVFETMPWSREVMAALLEFDLIGLQAVRWENNFLQTARGLLGSEAEARAKTKLRVIPVGIDPDRFAEAALSAPTAELGSVEKMLGGRQLVLGVDRLDYSKGIPERLEAFARLLERYPEWRSKISFVQVSVPTRSEVPEYAELRGKVESLVGRINGTYGEADWTPVRYLYRSYDQATLARLYRHAAVGLVTPLRDGMNLVAKEYVAAQDAENPGVLVLSRFCGAAEHMTLAKLTNPYHKDGVAADLDAALRMPIGERIARHGALKSVVWKDTASAWARSFLDQLRA